MARAALAAVAVAPRLLFLTAAAGAGAPEASGASGRRLLGAACHADVLVKNLDYGGLAGYERAMLGPNVAKAIAAQNGVTEQAVLTPDGKPGSCGFFAGSYVAPWAPPDRRPYTAGSSTIISVLIDNCNNPTATLATFRTPTAHRAIEDSIQNTIGGSSALEGAAQVLGVAVVPATDVPSSAPAPAAPAPVPPAQPPPQPPAAPATVNVEPALPSPSGPPSSQRSASEDLMSNLPSSLGGKSAQPYLIPGAAGVALVLLVLGGLSMACRQTKKKKRRDEDEEDLLSSGSEQGH